MAGKKFRKASESYDRSKRHTVEEACALIPKLKISTKWDETVDVSTPEALIYEFRDGIARLVGVEYIVFAEQWHKTHAENDPPVLEGQLMHRYESPNRFGLPSFYELHVWAWRDNPLGTFADWNTGVSCDSK